MLKKILMWSNLLDGVSKFVSRLHLFGCVLTLVNIDKPKAKKKKNTCFRVIGKL